MDYVNNGFMNELTGTYNKFLGLYCLYYFNTSSMSGCELGTDGKALSYGLLYLTRNVDSDYAAYGVFNLTRDKLEELYHRYKNPSGFLDVLEHPDEHLRVYRGNLEISEEGAFITIGYKNRDRGLIVLYNPKINSDTYIGGLGTINSFSRGRAAGPCVQLIGLSRKVIDASSDIISRKIRLSLANIKLEVDTSELSSLINNLYQNPKITKKDMDDSQKQILIEAEIDKLIRDTVERNMFRHFKLTDRDDDSWYHFIKHYGR